MVKFAKGEEKPFDPISNKLLSRSPTLPSRTNRQRKVHLELHRRYPPCPAQTRGSRPESK